MSPPGYLFSCLGREASGNISSPCSTPGLGHGCAEGVSDDARSTDTNYALMLAAFVSMAIQGTIHIPYTVMIMISGTPLGIWVLYGWYPGVCHRHLGRFDQPRQKPKQNMYHAAAIIIIILVSRCSASIRTSHQSSCEARMRRSRTLAVAGFADRKAIF